VVSDTAYAASWDGVTDVAPSKNVVYDEVELIKHEGIRKNYIINGNFDLWSYGTSQTTSGANSADKWSMIHAQATKTASREAFSLGQTDVPGEPAFYLRHVVTTSNNAAENVIPQQNIDGVYLLSDKTVTLSFYAKADASKNISIECVQNFGSGGSPSASVNTFVSKIALTTSWARYTATFDIPSVSGKTLGTDNNSRVAIIIWLSAGSDYNARTDSLGCQSGTFDIARVALVEGADLDPIEKNKNEELALCLVSGQIRFPATQAASTDVNTLDDYEEGDWTPTFNVSAAEWSVAPTVDLAKYTKIGRMVFITLVAHGGTCQAFDAIGGLPVTATGYFTMFVYNLSTASVVGYGTTENTLSRITSLSAMDFSAGGTYFVLSGFYVAS
jgi:hypothetical protein